MGLYHARDVRLNRFIAAKVLPGTAALDPERRDRFEREAQASAALNHPNIVTIHSVEEADGLVVFLTMELVEGRSLAESMLPGGVPIDRLLRVAIAVADALAAAHQKGITHRDLKPANIMIGDGDTKGASRYSIWPGEAHRPVRVRECEPDAHLPITGEAPHPGHGGLYVAGAGRRQNDRFAI
jgi:serine/threonine protein kinase